MIPSSVGALAVALLPVLVGCQTDTEPADDPAAEIEAEVPVAGEDDKGDAPGWSSQDTLHLGERRYGSVDVGVRDILPMWVAGSAERPVSLTVRASGQDGAAIRVAVLGPLVDGERTLLGSAGYGDATASPEVTVEVADAGQVLVVVGSHRLASFAGYHVEARCADDGCGPDVVDALASPKVGALIGRVVEDGSALIQAELNLALAARDKFEVELWTSPPGMHWYAEQIAVSESSGNQVNFLLPPGTLEEGDDVLLVVRPGDGLPVADRGTWARFAPEPRLFARLDAILYSDLGAVTISGVTGYFEGHDELSLRRATGDVELAATSIEATLPGVAGIGFGSFDATLEPQVFLDDGETVNPDLPHDGDVLSVGRIVGDGSYRPFGCFEYCNDLAGTGSCTARPLPCP